MTAFQPKERCPKCGSMAEIYKFKNSNWYRLVEYLLMRCKTCNHKFKRATLTTEKSDGEV